MTQLPNSFWAHCQSLQTIHLPNLQNLTRIGAHCFSGCAALQTLVIPASVRRLDHHAFYRCVALSTMEFGDETSCLTRIDEGAFGRCSSLRHVTLPRQVTSLGRAAFLSCTSLQTVTLHQRLETIGQDAWDGCTALEMVTLVRPQKRQPSTVRLGDSDAAAATAAAAAATTSRLQWGHNALQSCTKLCHFNVEFESPTPTHAAATNSTSTTSNKTVAPSALWIQQLSPFLLHQFFREVGTTTAEGSGSSIHQSNNNENQPRIAAEEDSDGLSHDDAAAQEQDGFIGFFTVTNLPQKNRRTLAFVFLQQSMASILEQGTRRTKQQGHKKRKRPA